MNESSYYSIIQVHLRYYNWRKGWWITNPTMATAHLGTLSSFNPMEEPITSYLDCIQLLFVANSIGEGKQVPTFLSIIGPATYAILRNLFAPTLPPKCCSTGWHFWTSQEALWAQERYHCGVLPLTQKRSTRRRDGNAVWCSSSQTRNSLTTSRKPFAIDLFAAYVTELFLRQLLSEKEPTLAKAMDLAVSMEAAEKNTRSVKGQRFLDLLDSSIKKIKEQYRPRSHSNSQQSCYRCGKINHAANDCKFKDAICHTCGKKGHIAPVCRTMPTTNTQRMQQRRHELIWCNKIPLTPNLRNTLCSNWVLLLLHPSKSW